MNPISSIHNILLCGGVVSLLVSPLSAAVLTIIADRETTLFANNPDNNLGASDLVAGTTAGSQKARSLLSFDVASNLPAGSVINSVTFQIGAIRQSNLNQPSSYELHLFFKTWSEGNGSGNTGSAASAGQTTWNSQFHGTTLWSTPGGQAGAEYLALASGFGSVINIEETIYQIDSTNHLVADVQGWLDNPLTNNGWIFLGTSEGIAGTARRFSSTEVPGIGISSSLTPRIIVDFTPVPEPSTACLMLSLGTLALVRRRVR
jgi:hypothetical protein